MKTTKMKLSLFVGIGTVLTICSIGSGTFTLRILHTNDMHSRFEQTSKISTPCTPREKSLKQCYGGFARLATLIRQAKRSDMPTLFLNAGDNYQGTLWYMLHKWKIVSKFMNILEPDAMSLGNHEFDSGPEGLSPFINASKFPILAANLDLSAEPELAKTPLRKSTILDIRGRKIGIVGFLTPETKSISDTRRVKFLDEVTEIRKEVGKLQDQGINIIIALGHSGINVEKTIATEVDGIDLVIGGHSNTFLYTGKQPDIENPEDPYPIEIVQNSGRKVYVVQAYAYTKYLGNLTIHFDGKGEITSLSGLPILLDNSIEEADDVLAELEKWRLANNVGQSAVGTSKVFLDGNLHNCGKQECNLGDLITDSMVYFNAKQYSNNDSWTDAPISFVSAGGIRSSIDRTSGDMITIEDVLTVLPFKNRMVKIEIPGHVLRKALEWSVDGIVPGAANNFNLQFLQYSGINVTYDLSRPRGSRVLSAHVRCSRCINPSYEELENGTVYTALTDEFLRSGGDGYKFLADLEWNVLNVTIDAVVVTYLELNSPVSPEVSGRIKFLPLTIVPANDNSSSQN